MALRKAYLKTDDQGRIKLPKDVQRLADLKPGQPCVMMVLRIKQTTRWPHAVLFSPSNPPRLSAFEVMMEKGEAVVDKDGLVMLPLNILEEMKLKKDYKVEMKVQGPHNGHWLTVYNRGPWTETTLQQRMGVNRGKEPEQKTHKTLVWEY